MSTILYVALAVALCTAVSLIPLPDEFVGVLVPVAQLTPLIAALPFLRRGNVRDMLALRWPGAVRWSLIGLGLLAATAAVQLMLGLLLGWQVRGLDAILPAALALMPFLVLQSIFAIGEELGWRGWLVSRLRHLGFWVIALVSSAVWVVWHVPALMLFPFTAEEAAAYLAGIAAGAPLLVALRLASGSVWPAVIVHGGINSVRVFFLQSVAEPGGINWAVEALGWILLLGAAAWVSRRR